MRPKIWLGLASSTRFKVTLDDDGCRKLTAAAAPTLNVFQSMAARCVLWLMFMVAPDCAIFPVPATICPPVGN